ncbi:hypothetical protein [Methylobacterium sp. CM6246]
MFSALFEAGLIPRGADQVTNAEAIEVSALRRAPGLGAISLEFGREFALRRIDGLLQLPLAEPIKPFVEQGLFDVLHSRAIDGIKHRALAPDDIDANDRVGGLAEIEMLLRRGYP